MCLVSGPQPCLIPCDNMAAALANETRSNIRSNYKRHFLHTTVSILSHPGSWSFLAPVGCSLLLLSPSLGPYTPETNLPSFLIWSQWNCSHWQQIFAERKSDWILDHQKDVRWSTMSHQNVELYLPKHGASWQSSSYELAKFHWVKLELLDRRLHLKIIYFILKSFLNHN